MTSNNNNLLQVVSKIQRPTIQRNKGYAITFNSIRPAIAKMRQRRFSWQQIVTVLNAHGYQANYNNLYQWQLRTFKQKSRK